MGSAVGVLAGFAADLGAGAGAGATRPETTSKMVGNLLMSAKSSCRRPESVGQMWGRQDGHVRTRTGGRDEMCWAAGLLSSAWSTLRGVGGQGASRQHAMEALFGTLQPSYCMETIRAVHL
eukprot:34950-Chlamydomonas_euryale.AAC.3